MTKSQMRQLQKRINKTGLYHKRKEAKKERDNRRQEEPPIDEIPFNPDEDLLERAEALTPKAWRYLGGIKNRWPHRDGILYDLFYMIQDMYWEELLPGTLTEYYNAHGMTRRDIYGHTLEDFIIGALGVSR